MIVVTVVVGGGFALAANLGQRFAVGTNEGAHALAIAHGTTKKPRAMFVKVTSRPHQKVVGNYLDDCGKNGSGGTKGATFKGATPLVVKLKHRIDHPDACHAVGAAQLAGKGRVKVALYARSAG